MLLSAWFNTNETAIVPLSSCKNVIEAVLSYKKTDIIQNLEVLGIIDQDYSSVGAIEAIKKDVFVLPFHEIESLLLHEDIITEVLVTVGKTEEEIQAIVAEMKVRAIEIYPKDLVNKTISERYKNEIEFNLKYAIRGLKSTIDDAEQKKSHIDIINQLHTIAETSYDKASKEVTESPNLGYLEVLKILPGKPLLLLLLKTLGMTTDTYLSMLCKLIKDENEQIVECLSQYLPSRSSAK